LYPGPGRSLEQSCYYAAVVDAAVVALNLNLRDALMQPDIGVAPPLSSRRACEAGGCVVSVAMTLPGETLRRQS
jgi:hypothetical protein